MKKNIENKHKKMNNPLDKKVSELQTKFDNALDLQDIKTLETVLEEALQTLSTADLNSISKASLYYSIATTYGDLEMYSKEYQTEKNQEKQIFYFRKSLDSINEFGISDPENPYYLGFKLNLYTNYANSLSRIGRTIEAIKYFQKALAISPNFGMALGNSGIAYISYANIMSDTNHANIFHHVAYKLLKNTLSNEENLHSQAKQYFAYYLSLYDDDFKEKFLETELNFDSFSLGETEDEVNYRTWVLNNRLYLNPMNDLPFTDNFIATDILHLPSMRMKISDGINYKFHSMFNNLKQEFISARFNFFECSQLENDTHYADKETHILNTLDYTSFSIRQEKLKLSYRSLYSLFDKVAYFLNEYFDLGIKERDINFRSIWKEKKTGRNGYEYRNILPLEKNRALSGIHWLFKDLFIKLYESPSPHAKELNTLRNGLEHKFVNVYLDIFYDKDSESVETDSINISEESLEKFTYQLLNMVRELLIYLSLSVHINEQQFTGDKDEFVPPFIISELEDDWKL
ncbi:TPA: LA2681 family HEPN domain-containing protein [Listeria monocytogenes]